MIRVRLVLAFMRGPLARRADRTAERWLEQARDLAAQGCPKGARFARQEALRARRRAAACRNYVGPAKCPACGWDDGGELRSRNLYDDEAPPIPRPRFPDVEYEVIDSDGRHLFACPECDAELDPKTVAPRKAKA